MNIPANLKKITDPKCCTFYAASAEAIRAEFANSKYLSCDNGKTGWTVWNTTTEQTVATGTKLESGEWLLCFAPNETE